MRRLDEWHKYVDLQAQRATAAKAAPASLASAVDEEESSPEADRADIYSEPLAQSPYGEADQPVSESLEDDPEPAYMRPTPLPAQIEFATDDLPSHACLGGEDSPYSVTQAQPAPGLANGGHPAAHSPGMPASTGRFPRGGRPSGVERKETREELLARLLDPELTLEEAAQVLNVCPTTVRRYTNRGILSHFRTMGNQRRFRLSQVLAFLESQEAPLRPSLPKAAAREADSCCGQQALLGEESPAQS